MLQAIVGIAPEDIQPLAGSDVPVSLLLDLGKHPRFDEGSSVIIIQHNNQQSINTIYYLPGYHTACNSTGFTERVIVLVRQHITIACVDQHKITLIKTHLVFNVRVYTPKTGMGSAASTHDLI